jgi:lipoprotein-anchoring transpeptidase ErfK/SrfK
MARSPIRRINISLARQTLTAYGSSHEKTSVYPIASATNGAGEINGSECTPRGAHIIRAKIGDGLPINTVFVARRPTGEIYQEDFSLRYPDRDWILTRILWLSGCEQGFNRLGRIDTMARFIYIHGTPDSVTLGTPNSHGCIRMHNDHLLDVFNATAHGTPVNIDE